MCAFVVVGLHSTRSYMDHTQCVPLPRKRWPDGATTDCSVGHYWNLLFIYRPRKDERLSRPSWPTSVVIVSCRSSEGQGKFAG